MVLLTGGTLRWIANSESRSATNVRGFDREICHFGNNCTKNLQFSVTNRNLAAIASETAMPAIKICS
tara:strand:+ start:369 stop:569 length:201 start_codon:yes stop_codon:yes gene_type:complete